MIIFFFNVKKVPITLTIETDMWLVVEFVCVHAHVCVCVCVLDHSLKELGLF